MINKKVFEEEILTNMEQNLQPSLVKCASNNLDKAIDYLQSASEIFEDLGMVKKSDQIIKLLTVIANNSKSPLNISDPHTKGLTPDKMVKNLLDHGTEFNMADDGSQVNDLLNLDINDADLEVLEDEILSDMDFEDEV